MVWESVFSILRTLMQKGDLPSVTALAEDNRDPFKILISTVISLRTRDEVTVHAADRLFAKASTPAGIAALEPSEIGSLIYPAGFYAKKGIIIREIASIISNRYNGIVPGSESELLSLPGVGRKTVNLTLGLGFGVPAICVDTHVHRVSNRCGWVGTRTPAETEEELKKILPRRYWIEINTLLVHFGRTVCVPVSPKCSQCPIRQSCPRAGVGKSR